MKDLKFTVLWMKLNAIFMRLKILPSERALRTQKGIALFCYGYLQTFVATFLDNLD